MGNRLGTRVLTWIERTLLPVIQGAREHPDPDSPGGDITARYIASGIRFDTSCALLGGCESSSNRQGRDRRKRQVPGLGMIDDILGICRLGSITTQPGRALCSSWVSVERGAVPW